MELQTILNTFAKDIFRKQADLDYVAARSNFRMKLRQQFLWSAQQTLEKYFKGILLFNGRSSRYPQGSKKEFGHNLVKLREEIDSISSFTFDIPIECETFIKYLADQGPNRYISTTAYNEGNALRHLDSTVWHIRRYCQFIPDRELGGKTPVPGLKDAFIRAMLNPVHQENPQRFILVGGELEKIVKREPSDPARRALVWANLFYGSKRRTIVRYRTFSSSEVPPNERDWPNVNWELINEYVRL